MGEVWEGAEGENEIQEIILQEIPDADPQAVDNVVSRVTQEFSESYHRGPLHSPSVLKEYEEVLSGSAKKILAGMEKEQKHRFEMEKHNCETERQVITAYRQGVLRGQILGFTLGLVTLGSGFYLSYLGKDTAAVSSILGTLALLTAAFMTGKHFDSKSQ